LAGFEPRPPVTPLKERCLRGHQLAGDNLLVNSRGERYCRECARLRAERARRRRARRERGLSKYKARRYDQWAAEGRCTRCGGERDDERFVTCSSCRSEMRARWRERYAARPLGHGELLAQGAGVGVQTCVQPTRYAIRRGVVEP
jgi:hypothetical protein